MVAMIIIIFSDREESDERRRSIIEVRWRFYSNGQWLIMDAVFSWCHCSWSGSQEG